jgi:hypothetical protein
MAMNAPHLLDGRLLVVAFEGWNDAGEAASSAVRVLQELLELVPLHVFDSETFYDYQYVRPTIGFNDEGSRVLRWPTSTVFAPWFQARHPFRWPMTQNFT